MKRARKIIAYLAVSADGYIARPDGDVEWLNRRPHTIDYGYAKFYASIDTVLLGRGTFDWAVRYMKQHPGRRSSIRASRTTCSRIGRPSAEFPACSSHRSPPKQSPAGCALDPVRTSG